MKTVVEKLFENADLHPDKLAVVFENEEVTYGQLKDAVIRLASWFKLHGVAEGDRIIAQAHYGKWYIAAYYAAHLCGAIIVPVEKRLTQETLQGVVKQMDAKAVVSWLEPVAPVSLNYGDIDAELAGIEMQPYTFPALDLVANIMLTSGTTGTPKGAMLTQRNNAANSTLRLRELRVMKDDVSITLVPINHVGCTKMLDGSMYNGSTYVMLDGIIKLQKFYECFEKYRVTSFNLPPAFIAMLERLSGDKLHDFADQMDYCMLHASPMQELQKTFLKRVLPKSRLYYNYGSSENGIVTLLRFDLDDKDIRCVGRTCQGVDVRILNESMTDVPQGEQGRIAIRSELNFKGYWAMPELTSRVYHDGFYLSNDAGYMDADGYLYILGRVDDVINVGGLKLYPSEVETAAMEIEGVAECLCVDSENPLTGKTVKLLVRLQDGSGLKPMEIRGLLADKLDSYKVPASIEIVEEIKKNSLGKPDRKSYRT